MHLKVRQKDGQPQEYRFHESPIHIGRGESNQVVLSDRMVSKRHAVVFSTDDPALLERMTGRALERERKRNRA